MAEQVVAETAYSAAATPEIANEESAMDEPVLFLRVTVLAAVGLPRPWLPKLRLVAGVRVSGSTPVPLSATTCGLLEADVVTVNVAACAPSDAGTNVAVSTQLVWAARELPHAEASTPKALPAGSRLTPTIEIGPLVLFRRVRLLGTSGRPIPWLPKLKLAGASVTGSTPLPKSATERGLPEASSVTISTAVLAPVDPGTKLTLRVQLAPAARPVPQSWLSENEAASAPANWIEATCKGASPVLESVAVFVALRVPVATLPNARLEGASPATGAPLWPVRLTRWGWPTALLPIVRSPVCGPATVGVNVTVTVQLARGASDVEQSCVWPKSPVAPIGPTAAAKAPVFVTVTTWGPLVAPMACEPKARLEGETLSVPWSSKLKLSGGCPAKPMVTLSAKPRQSWPFAQFVLKRIWVIGAAGSTSASEAGAGLPPAAWMRMRLWIWLRRHSPTAWATQFGSQPFQMSLNDRGSFHS